MAEVVPLASRRAYERQVRESVARTLRLVREERLKEVLVIGFGRTGDLWIAASPGDPGNAMWLMAAASKKLLGD